MTTFIFANQAESVVGSDVLFTDTTITIASGTGINFPAPATRQILALTLNNALNPAITEIVYCTNITGDVLTVTRGQEGTTPRNWYVGDFISNLFTAGTSQNFQQMNSGTTAHRPIPTTIGQSYFDTTLGYPIYCLEVTPSIMWVDGGGVIV